MINDPLYNDLREASWRRKLTGAQEAQLRAWLAAHPESLADWEAETDLNEALGRLPDAVVPSNFTAQVLQALERETAAASRAPSPIWRIRLPRWLPRAAVAAVVLGAGLFSYHQVRAEQRKALVRSVEAVSDVASLPNPKILEDFDAIRAMNQAPAADEELLALMQ
jgi:anti-sigma factor RsiW